MTPLEKKEVIKAVQINAGITNRLYDNVFKLEDKLIEQGLTQEQASYISDMILDCEKSSIIIQKIDQYLNQNQIREIGETWQ